MLRSPALPADLPRYPWQRERHWVRAARPVDARRQAAPATGWDSRLQEWLRTPCWVRAEPVTAAAAPEPGEWLVVTERAAWGQALVERLNTRAQVASQVAPEQLDIALQAAAGRAPLRGVLVCPEPTAAARYMPIAALQALSRHSHTVGGGGPRLWFGTFGAQAVPGHDRPRVSVDAAAAWGAGRVVAEEHPEFWGGLVDLDPAAGDAANADWLARELLGAGGESQVAWRSGERFTLRLQNLGGEAGEPQPMAWRPDAAYLLTGGLGGVGLHVSAAMVAQGARRLVMLGRSALPERSQWAAVPADSLAGRRITAIRALESAGASVHLLQADVADAQSLEQALQRYTAEAWPPIRGVIHAAGTTENHLVLQTDPQAFARVVAPKLDGALHLDRLLPDLDAFILFSSVSATIGWPGMANYAAANAGLDALACDRRARGLPGLSIQWGPWEDTGLHAGEVARQQTAELLRQGVQHFTAAQGQAVFGALAGRSDALVTVMPADWAMFQTARRGRDLRLYADLLPGAGADAADGVRLSERLAALDHPGERRKLLEPAVRDAVGRVLKLAPARLDPRKPLGAMGLSSLLAMELRNRLEAALDRPLSATLAWNYPTVDALVGFLAGEAAAAPAAPAADLAAPLAAAAIGAVAELSDEDAARLLRRR
jgi:myxalamid-type polyketide synthase MxaE and MxaD